VENQKCPLLLVSPSPQHGKCRELRSEPFFLFLLCLQITGSNPITLIQENNSCSSMVSTIDHSLPTVVSG
jgi:hypothetical protein